MLRTLPEDHFENPLDLLEEVVPHFTGCARDFHAGFLYCTRVSRHIFAVRDTSPCFMIHVSDASTWPETPDNWAWCMMLESGRESLGFSAAGAGFVLKSHVERSPALAASNLWSIPLSPWPGVHSPCNVKYKHPPPTSYIFMAMGSYI